MQAVLLLAVSKLIYFSGLYVKENYSNCWVSLSSNHQTTAPQLTYLAIFVLNLLLNLIFFFI